MPEHIKITPQQRTPDKRGLDLGKVVPHGGQAPNDFKPCSRTKNVGNGRGPVVDVRQNPGAHRMRY